MSNTKPVQIYAGVGRTKVSLSALLIGDDLLVRLSNRREHIGAVALSEYNYGEKRASTSVLTRFGHRDDTIASMAAYEICRRFKGPVCAIAGIHVDNITKEEIEQIVKNCRTLIDRYIQTLSSVARDG
ncbi:MAG: hypothetical protein P8Y80_04515 [Acidobacteriota bacterium]|jgi:hypothetical protein